MLWEFSPAAASRLALNLGRAIGVPARGHLCPNAIFLQDSPLLVQPGNAATRSGRLQKCAPWHNANSSASLVLSEGETPSVNEFSRVPKLWASYEEKALGDRRNAILQPAVKCCSFNSFSVYAWSSPIKSKEVYLRSGGQLGPRIIRGRGAVIPHPLPLPKP